MTDSLVKYKRFGMEELQKAFFGEQIFFSRSAQFRARSPGLPDLVLVNFTQEQSGWVKEYRIIIRAEMQPRPDYASDVLKRQGYEYDTTGKSYTWIKSVFIISRAEERPLQFLHKIVLALDDMVVSLPFHIYESQHSKRLRDYVDFMTSCQDKLKYSDVVRRLGGREDMLNKAAQKVFQSHYIRRSIFLSSGESCRIAHLPNNQWCAWVVGDDYIPTFPTEKLAFRFLENRNTFYARLNPGRRGSGLLG